MGTRIGARACVTRGLLRGEARRHDERSGGVGGGGVSNACSGNASGRDWNGPGRRAVLWVQGCSLACPGCFNPETHAIEGGQSIAVAEFFDLIDSQAGEIEGLTVSGGEPLQQLEALTQLLRLVREHTELSVLLFTGLRLEEILRLNSPQ